MSTHSAVDVPVRVCTTVATRDDEVDEVIRKFLSNGNNERKVIGLDTQWMPQGKGSSSAILQLCDGDSCLIINIYYRASLPTSLFNFLRLPEYKFVGIGIKENMVKLEKEHGLDCKNSVDLRTLAATVRNQPCLAFCGLDDLLALEVNWLKLQKPMSVVFQSWNQLNHGKCKDDQVKHAMLTVYAYFHIGYSLFAGF